MLPDALKESMAGAGVDDDEPNNANGETDVVADSLDNDGVVSDSLQEVGEIAPLAGDDDTSFPEDNDTRTAWDDEDRPSRSAAIAAQLAANKPETDGEGSKGGKAAWAASLVYLLLLGGVGGYLAFVAEAPPPQGLTSDVRVVVPIEGEIAIAPPAEPDPEPQPEPDVEPVTVTGLPPQPEPIEPTVIEPTTVPDTVAVAPTPDTVTPEPETVAVVRDEGQPPREPQAGLQEPSEFGPLPIIFGNGRPHQVYARTVPPLDVPRISLVMIDLGLDRTRTEVAIEQLPADVSLAFHAYAPDLNDWISSARGDGHESLLAIPMEPVGYPLDDPGPNALLVGNTPSENQIELHKSLGAAEGYVGVINFMGSALMADFNALAPVVEELSERGLLFIDNNSAINSVAPEVTARYPLPFARANRLVDSLPTAADIDEQLANLEALAKIRGEAVGLIQPYPVTYQRLEEWIPELRSRGIDLVPVSAIASFRQGAEDDAEAAQQAEAPASDANTDTTNSDG